MRSAKKESVTRVTVINSKQQNLTFFLEPWGDEYEMRPEDRFVLLFYGPNPGDPEVVVSEDGVTVWGWTGSTVRVIKNDTEIVHYAGAVVPAFPGGL